MGLVKWKRPTHKFHKLSFYNCNYERVLSLEQQPLAAVCSPTNVSRRRRGQLHPCICHHLRCNHYPLLLWRPPWGENAPLLGLDRKALPAVFRYELIIMFTADRFGTDFMINWICIGGASMRIVSGDHFSHTSSAGLETARNWLIKSLTRWLVLCY